MTMTAIRAVTESPWRIVPLATHHLSAVSGIDRDCFAPERQWQPGDYALKHDQGWEVRVALSAKDPTVLAGFVIFGLVEGKRVDIDRFAVAPAHQRQGIGKRLILSAVQWAVAQDVVEVTSLANVYEDLPAQCLLRSCYFRVPRGPRAAVCESWFPFKRSLAVV